MKESCHVLARVPGCQAKATRRVHFVDGDTVPACEECATYLEMQAENNDTSVTIERIR